MTICYKLGPDPQDIEAENTLTKFPLAVERRLIFYVYVHMFHFQCFTCHVTSVPKERNKKPRVGLRDLNNSNHASAIRLG